MSIDELKPGQRGIVSRIRGIPAIRRRLYDMGLVPRAVVRVDRLAPLGDPIWVRLGDNGTQMALRRQEAKTVMVDIIADASAPKESL